jgi:hypothetical protein
MQIRHLAVWGLVLAGGLALSGCGHDDDGFFNNDVDPSGVYEGAITDEVTQQTTPIVAVIDENGDGRMMAQNGAYYALGVNSSGDNVFGPLLQFTGNGSSIQGNFNGQATESGLSLSFQPQSGDAQSLNLNFDNVYLTPSSLPTLQGNWSTASGAGFSLNLSIQSTGAFTGTDSNNCSYSGFFNLVDPQVNAYTETFTQTCGATVDSNFFGLAYFIPASGSGSGTTPNTINFLADDGNTNFVSAMVQFTAAAASP